VQPDLQVIPGLQAQASQVIRVLEQLEPPDQAELLALPGRVVQVPLVLPVLLASPALLVEQVQLEPQEQRAIPVIQEQLAQLGQA
jgi:hypothetical protein